MSNKARSLRKRLKQKEEEEKEEASEAKVKPAATVQEPKKNQYY